MWDTSGDTSVHQGIHDQADCYLRHTTPTDKTHGGYASSISDVEICDMLQSQPLAKDRAARADATPCTRI